MISNQTTWAPNFRDWIPPERRAHSTVEGKSKRYVVRLTDEERSDLVELAISGKAAANTINRARILLRVDADGLGWSDARVAKALRCCTATVANVRQQLVEQGLKAALEQKKAPTRRRRWRRVHARHSRPRVYDRVVVTKLLALLDQEPPRGKPKWSCSLLADRLVKLEVVPSISGQSVRQMMNQAGVNRSWNEGNPLENNDESASAIEDMIDRHRRLCGDERLAMLR